MLRRAAKEADATALGETQVHLGMAAAIILINIGLSTLRLWPSALTRDIAIFRRASEVAGIPAQCLGGPTWASA